MTGKKLIVMLGSLVSLLLIWGCDSGPAPTPVQTEAAIRRKLDGEEIVLKKGTILKGKSKSRTPVGK